MAQRARRGGMVTVLEEDALATQGDVLEEEIAQDAWDGMPVKGQNVSYFLGGIKAFWKLLTPEKQRIKVVLGLVLVHRLLVLMVPYQFEHAVNKFSLVFEKGIGVIGWNLFGMFVAAAASVFMMNLVIIPKFFLPIIINLENWWPVIAQKKLMALSLSFHAREGTGKKIGKINKGCEKLVSLIDHFFWALFPPLTYMLINIGILFHMDPKIGVMFFVPIGIAVVICRKIYAMSRSAWEEWEVLKEKSIGYLCQSIVNVATVQAYVQEAREERQLANVRKDMCDLDIACHVVIQRYYFWLGLATNASFMTMITLALFFYHRGTTTMGTVTYLFITGNQTLGMVNEIMQAYTRIMRDLFAAYRLNELLEEPVTVQNAAVPTPAPESFEKISFQGVEFRYDENSSPVLSGFTLEAKRGETIGLVGHSGGGKSTAVQLLCRGYGDVTDGAILLDDTDIRLLDRDGYRKLFAVVRQEVEIFDATMWENITYGYPDAPREKVIEAVKMAHLWDLVSDPTRFPNGLLTQVGERGVKLSGGQRQRLEIARARLALLCGAKILILDEATSHLDSESEAGIQQALSEFQGISGVTTFVIAHRLSTVERADRICVVEGGRISEEGTHAELMQRSGLYARLVALQNLSRN